MKSDYLPWDKFLKIKDLLIKDQTLQSTQYLAFVLVGGFSGLRISDILKLKYSDLKSNVLVTEQKTKKKREITIDKDVLKMLFECQRDLVKSDDDLIVPFTRGHCSHILKKLAERVGVRNIAISCHTLRKTFARQLWIGQGETEAGLVLLSQILNHSSIGITRTYLGITDQEISSAYLSLKLNPKKSKK